MIILIDDDKLIRLAWSLKARKSDKEFISYSSVVEFFDHIHDFPLDSEIYIDSDLKNGIKGEVESRKIFEIGFKNIYLATGFEHYSLSDFPWLKGIISKTPPF